MAQLHAHQHVVLFTHNEQSHISPMLALGQALASRGLRATCALPATSCASYWDNNNSSQIKDELFQVVPVAEAAEQSSNDIFMLQEKLEEGLVQLINRLQPPPSCLIADMVYFTWSKEVADRCGVVRFQFSPFLATTLLVGFHFPELLEMGLLPLKPGAQDKVIDFIPGLMKGFRLADVPLEFLGRSAAELEAYNFLKHSEGCAGFIMSHTSYVLEGEAKAIDALIKDHGLRIYPVAPMLHIQRFNNGTLPIDYSSIGKEGEECLNWLDKQPNGSVVYASFGGIISLTQGDIHELALALEACGQPFLWVARRLEDGSDVMSMLPSGFLERTSGRGCIFPWASQMAVLSHTSVGCFLTHCGCTSVLEALWTGVSMIGGFNKICDQNTTLRLMMDSWGVALPLKSEERASLRSTIVASIHEVLHGQAVGAAIKQRTLELKAAIRKSVEPNGVSHHSLDQFVDALLSYQIKQSYDEV